MNRRGAVIVNKLERCLGVEDREVEGIHIGAERCIERHRLCARDLVLYVLVPVGNQLFAQLRSVRQQATERCARASGGNKVVMTGCGVLTAPDRKSTRLNSSHVRISYAVFCLKKKKRPYSGFI